MAGGMKSLAKDTAIYGMSSIVGRLLNWALMPIYTHVLENTGEYGIVTNLYSWVALMLVVLTYGMETGFFRFINKKDEQEPMRIYSTSLFSLAFTSALFITVSFSFISPISGFLGYASNSDYIAMLLGIVAVDAFCSIPFAYLRYKNRPIRFAAIKLISILLNIFLNIFFLIICPKIYETNSSFISWFYHPGYGVGYVFVSNVITTILTFILLLPDILQGMKYRPDFAKLKEMFRYSFPVLILGIAGIFNQNAASILFPFLFEDREYATSQLGIYSAFFKVAIIMVMFIQAFRYAYEPFVFAKNKDDDSKRTYIDAMKYFIIFSLVIFIGVMYYLDIVKYIVDPRYYAGLVVVPVVMLGELFYGIYYNLSIWYKLTDSTQWGAYFSIIGCSVTVVLIILFVPAYGFIACAWTMFACNLLMMLMSYFTGQKKFPVAYDLKSAIFYTVLTTVFYIAGMLPQIESTVLRLGYRTILFLIFLAIIVKKDFPLSTLPVIGRYFKKYHNE
jgi:O-antigen/teichoic acid export membrane protein